MKKTITLLMMALALAWMLPQAIGQNLMINAGVEQWDDPNNPTDWDKVESTSQEAVTVHEGTYSAAHTSSDGGTQDFHQVV